MSKNCGGSDSFAFLETFNENEKRKIEIFGTGKFIIDADTNIVSANMDIEIFDADINRLKKVISTIKIKEIKTRIDNIESDKAIEDSIKSNSKHKFRVIFDCKVDKISELVDLLQ